MNYVREMTVVEILKASFGIYFKHFGTLFLIFLLGLLISAVSIGITLGIIIGPAYAFPDVTKILTILGVIIGYFVFFFIINIIPAASTVAVSEITLGHKPSLVRAYKRILGTLLGKLTATNLLQAIILAVGFILLIIPGIYFMLKYYLSMPVVVLENIWGRDALKRSGELGKGHLWRILGIYILFSIILSLVLEIIFFLSIAAVGKILGFIVYFLFLFLLVPVGVIPFVLVYYDLRVRKEGYDTAALAEDLQH